MRIDIHGHQLSLSPALREHAERRLRFALGRFAPRLWRARLTFTDVNGPRGGIDKRCSLTVRGEAVDLQVSDSANDAYAAADLVCDRAGRAVARAVERERARI